MAHHLRQGLPGLRVGWPASGRNSAGEKRRNPAKLHSPDADDQPVGDLLPVRGVLFAGGSDASRHLADVFILCWSPQGGLKTEPLPLLPEPMANGCGALIGMTVYIAGGEKTPGATAASSQFWSLDLAAAPPQWITLPTWPGPARTLAAGAPYTLFYFYDIPVLTHVNISMDEFLERGEVAIPTLAGLKFTNSDLMACQLTLRACGGAFDVPWGVDEFMLGALALGARGQWAARSTLPRRSTSGNPSAEQLKTLHARLEGMGFFEWIRS